MHQLDLVTPRYISGYGKIISVNRVDVYNNKANADQYVSKGVESVMDFIIADWQKFGIPQYLQLDNEAAFRGSLSHIRTFGVLSRFCLNFDVQLLFIPFNEPWRNGYIESFNSRFNELLWQSQRFKDLEHLKTESKKFIDKHNNYQAYKKNNFSKKVINDNLKLKCLPSNFNFDISKNMPIIKGKINFVRLIDEKGYVNILNEQIYINKDLSFEYVWLMIDTQFQNLKIFYQATKKAPRVLIKVEPYKLRESVKNRIPIKEFC